MTTHHLEPGLGRPPAGDRGSLLRLSLQLDAVASGALGLLSLVAAPVLDGFLGMPVALLVSVGSLVTAYAAVLWTVATRSRIPRPAVGVVIAGNLLWVAASVAVVAAGWFSLTAPATA